MLLIERYPLFALQVMNIYGFRREPFESSEFGNDDVFILFYFFFPKKFKKKFFFFSL